MSMRTLRVRTIYANIRRKQTRQNKKQEKQRKTKEKGDCYGRRKRTDFKAREKITDRIPYKLGMEKLTVNDPEYWGLAGVVTDEMAEVALCMDVRKPITLPKLAKKTKKPEAELEKLLQEMAVVGIIEYNWENPQHEKQYILPMYVPGSAEFMVMNKEQVEKHTEIADFFENMSRLPLEKVTPMVPLGGAGIGMHVIPVEKAIPAAQESADVEHISHWLKSTRTSMQSDSVPAVCSRESAEREPAILRASGASVSAIWQTSWYRPEEDTMWSLTKC